MNERIAGRELDAEIAEMMGWEWFVPAGEANSNLPFDRMLLLRGEWPHDDRLCAKAAGHEPIANVAYQPSYSSDIAAAFQVVEAMRAKGFSCRIDVRVPYRSGDERRDRVQFTRYDDTDADSEGLVQGRAEEDSLPLAICLASLEGLRDKWAAPAPPNSALESPQTPTET